MEVTRNSSKSIEQKYSYPELGVFWYGLPVDFKPTLQKAHKYIENSTKPPFFKKVSNTNHNRVFAN
jgi:hypothetical protein